jgi:micrococcal nuclease
MQLFKKLPTHLTAFLIFLCCTTIACGNPKEPQEALAANAFPVKKANSEQVQALPHKNTWYTVSKFIDGDTFWINDSTATGIKVRLIGMDTPEAKNVFKKKKHPMGKEVARYVETLLTGTKIRLELDVQHHDQYGRVLAYVFLEDGTHLNAHLIEKGYAWLMTVPPNVKYADEFYELQVLAREQKKGLWDGSTFDDDATYQNSEEIK